MSFQLVHKSYNIVESHYNLSWLKETLDHKEFVFVKVLDLKINMSYLVSVFSLK